MELVPIKEEVAWSRQAAAHVAMLQQSVPPPGPLKFAVASVRPIPPPGPGTVATYNYDNLKCLGADGLLWALRVTASAAPSAARRGRRTAPGASLQAIVLAAYASSPRPSMRGYPFNPDPFSQIEAVADDPERVTKRELQQMLQALLEDRFKARVHHETREVDGYVMTIAKSGVKFKRLRAIQEMGTPLAWMESTQWLKP